MTSVSGLYLTTVNTQKQNLLIIKTRISLIFFSYQAHFCMSKEYLCRCKNLLVTILPPLVLYRQQKIKCIKNHLISCSWIIYLELTIRKVLNMALKQLINWFGGSFDIEFIQIGHLVVDKMQVTHLKHLLLTPKNR